MSDLVSIIIGVLVAAVVFWLLSYAVPVFVAAIIAVVLFLVIVFGVPRTSRRP